VTDTYHAPNYDGPDALWAAIARDDVEYLQHGIVAAALDEDDYATVRRICVALSDHRDELVRGNAILGFGHLARRFGEVAPGDARLVRAATLDDSGHVAGHARSAADDIHMFVGVDVLVDAPGQR